jgi:C4-dicarboxylate-specific signal transduction histidine kinase
MERGPGPSHPEGGGARARKAGESVRRTVFAEPSEEAAIAIQALAAVYRRETLAEIARAGSAPAIGEFAGLVAHETTQPIAAILLNCAAARNLLAAPNADLTRTLETIGRIERDARRASAVIQRIGSLMTGEKPQYMALDLNHLIEDALHVLDHELGHADVVVTKELGSDLPLVSGDPVQLGQVLVNLCSNAIEAMRSTSDGPRALRVRTGLEGGRPFVIVRDTGPGVDPRARERLFEPHFTTKTDGMGLGLCLSRAIVSAHGGQLWANVGESPGASFCFTLRTASERAESDAPAFRASARDMKATAVHGGGVRRSHGP